MLSRFLSSFVIALTLAAAVSTHAATANRPNILIVLVDDVGYGDFGFAGHPFMKTPNIDRLHGESVRLTDFHVAPMCSPTRGQLMTGCHGLRTGVTSVTAGRTYLRPEFPTAPQMFAAAGYRTGIFGKWHLGDAYPHRPIDKGFQEALWARGWGFTSAPEFSNTLIDGTLIRGATPEKFSGYVTDVCFDEAMKWMRTRGAAHEPFFCYVPLHAGHAPHTVPEKYAAPYRGKGAAPFFGMIACIDENMGKLDAFLRDTGLRDNTVVIFMTDNGGTAGVVTYNAGLRGKKVEYYDGGHRVPCLVRWPAGGLRPAGDVGALTQVQDILPTLLEFSGAKKLPGPDFDGASLAALLRGQTDRVADRTFVVQYGPGIGETDNNGPKKFQAAIMRDSWRLVHGTELYDLSTDRAQAKDLAATRPELVADLRASYEKWWSGVAPRLNEFVPVLTVGATQENPIMLSSSDWQDTYADNANHVRNAIGGPRGGPWNVLVERAGTYEIAVRRWPFDTGAPLDGNVTPPGKALPIAAAKFTVGTRGFVTAVAPGAVEAVFRAQLSPGRTQLRAWFQDKDATDLCGAFYAKITRVGD